MHLRTSISNYLDLSPCREDLCTEVAVGIELEYESMIFETETTSAALTKVTSWEIVPDGSLRNNGMELVSVPLLTNEVDSALQQAEELVRAASAVATPRCGLHTHMNMRPYSIGQVWSLACLYALIEPTLFATYAVNREDSMFAVPLWSNTEQTNALHRDMYFMRSFPLQFPRLSIIQTSKYAALNFSSLPRLGTLEMRQPYCSTDFNAIRSWVQFCQRLMRIGTQYTDPLEVLVKYEEHGLLELQRELFGDGFPVDSEKQEAAEDAAWMIAGYTEPSWEDLTWDIPTLEAS